MSGAAWTIDAGSPSERQAPKMRRPARLSGSGARADVDPSALSGANGTRSAPRSASGLGRVPRPPIPRPPAVSVSADPADDGADGDVSSRPGLTGPPSEASWADSGPVMGAGPYLPPRPPPAAMPSFARGSAADGYGDEDTSDMLRTAPGIGRVRVCVRVRPMLPSETSGAGMEAAPVARASSDGECLELVLARGADQETTRSFQFDRVFGPEASQEDFFERSGAKALIDNLLAGLNVSLFCYGQTGAGKTYTLSGTTERISMAAAHDLLDGDSSRARPSEGLMPRAIRYLYQRLHEEEMQAQAEADAAAGTAADGDGSGTGGGDGESGFGEVGATGGAGAAPAGRRLGGASAPRVKTVVRVAMCELHNEAIYDLLNVTGEALPLRWSPTAGFFPQGQLVIATGSARQVLEVMAEGHANRSVGTHALNADSSRSHSLLTVYVERTVTMNATEGDAGAGAGPSSGARGRGGRRGLSGAGGGSGSGRARTITVTTRSKGVFVDLAGSERLKESGSEGATATETRIINKSLFALGKVIAALAERKRLPAAAAGSAGGAAAAAAAAAARTRGMGAAPSRDRDRATRSAGTAPRSGAGTRGGSGGGGGGAEDEGPHVPYRDSKLTKLLQDSLGGTSVTLMVACVSPAARFAEETMHTLRHALRARRIENAPLVQVDGKDALILSLRRENRELRAEVAALRAAMAGAAAGPGGLALAFGGRSRGTSVPDTPPLLALQLPVSVSGSGMGSWPPSPAFASASAGPLAMAMAMQQTPHDSLHLHLRHGAGLGHGLVHANSFGFGGDYTGERDRDRERDLPPSPPPWPGTSPAGTTGAGASVAASPDTPASVSVSGGAGGGAGAFHLLRGEAPLNPLRNTAMGSLPSAAAVQAQAQTLQAPVQVPAAPAWLQAQQRSAPSPLSPLSPVPSAAYAGVTPATPSEGAASASAGSAEKDGPTLSGNASSGALSGLHLPPPRKSKTPLAGSRGYSASAGLSAAAAGLAGAGAGAGGTSSGALISPSGSAASASPSAPSSGGTTASHASYGSSSGPLPPDTPHSLQELRSMARAAAAAVISAGGGHVAEGPR